MQRIFLDNCFPFVTFLASCKNKVVNCEPLSESKLLNINNILIRRQNISIKKSNEDIINMQACLSNRHFEMDATNDFNSTSSVKNRQRKRTKINMLLSNYSLCCF